MNSPRWKKENGGSNTDYMGSPQGKQGTQQDATQESPAIMEGRRLYVGNLPYTAKPSDVQELFVERGFVVEDLAMSTDPFTGLNPSYCFIELNSKEEADRAKEEITGKAAIEGRLVKVNNVVPKKDLREGKIKSYDNGWKPKQTNEAYDNSKKFTINRWDKTDVPSYGQGVSEERRRLYVGGLPQINGQGLLDEKIRGIFSKYKIEVVSKLVSPHEKMRSQAGSHYFCFVVFEDAQEAAAAVLEMDNKPTEWGGSLRVRIAQPSTGGKGRRGFEGLLYETQKPRESRDFSNNWRAR